MIVKKEAFKVATILVAFICIAMPACVSDSSSTEKSEAKIPTEVEAPKKGSTPTTEAQSSTKQNKKATPKKSTQAKKTKDFRVSEDDKYASIRSGGFFTTTSVEGLTPEIETTVFQSGQKVYAFAGIHAPRKETVRMTWIGVDGKEILPSAYLDVEPNTGEVGYRVFTYRIFRTPGNYKVVLSNSVGENIGETKFEVAKLN